MCSEKLAAVVRVVRKGQVVMKIADFMTSELDVEKM
jgi:hypothetical protein